MIVGLSAKLCATPGFLVMVTSFVNAMGPGTIPRVVNCSSYHNGLSVQIKS